MFNKHVKHSKHQILTQLTIMWGLLLFQNTGSAFKKMCSANFDYLNCGGPNNAG